VEGCALCVLAQSLTTRVTIGHPTAENQYGELLSRASEHAGLTSSRATVGSCLGVIQAGRKLAGR